MTVLPSSFFASSSYKEYLESATSFNRKLNEERKMRIPYIDGQTGVAQRHYDNQRSRRERMPPKERTQRGGMQGQVKERLSLTETETHFGIDSKSWWLITVRRINCDQSPLPCN